MKKIFLFVILSVFYFSSSFADNSYFIDFKSVLNTSKAGSDAQKKLKKEFEDETKKFSTKEAEIKKEEKDIISKKKLITKEEYLNKVNLLRKKVLDLQKNKQKVLSKIAKRRNDAKLELLKAVNPIVKKYMEDNNIRIVLDKQSILMGDSSLEITSQIITILNKELSSLKIN